MGEELIVRSSNLAVPPQVCPGEGATTAVGDLHGNALKLVYTLIQEGILEISEEEYRNFLDIYNKDGSYGEGITDEDVIAFQGILDRGKWNNARSIILIGDELADRGNNDYLNLLIMKKLKEEQVDVEIILSNHSIEFIKDYERALKKEHLTETSAPLTLPSSFIRSLKNMQALVARSTSITTDSVNKLVDQVYKPMVKAISYTVSAKGDITIFTHAPVGLETIQSLANTYGITYSDSPPGNLLRTIDEINSKIQAQFSNNLGEIYDKGYQKLTPGVDYSRSPIPLDAPLTRLLFNRSLGDETCTTTSEGRAIKFVHGHIGSAPLHISGNNPSLATMHQNLDNDLGKHPDWSLYEGRTLPFLTRRTDDLTAKQIAEQGISNLNFPPMPMKPSPLTEPEPLVSESPLTEPGPLVSESPLTEPRPLPSESPLVTEENVLKAEDAPPKDNSDVIAVIKALQTKKTELVDEFKTHPAKLEKYTTRIDTDIRELEKFIKTDITADTIMERLRKNRSRSQMEHSTYYKKVIRPLSAVIHPKPTSLSEQPSGAVKLAIEKLYQEEEKIRNKTGSLSEKDYKRLDNIQQGIVQLQKHPSRTADDVINLLRKGMSWIAFHRSSYYKEVIKPLERELREIPLNNDAKPGIKETLKKMKEENATQEIRPNAKP